MPGQAHPPLARLLSIACAAFFVAVLPAVGGPNPGHTAAVLRLQNDQLAVQARSAVLDLYSLDSRLAAAQAHLTSLRAQAGHLQVERAALKRQLRIARLGKESSEQQLAARIRQLYEQGDVSPIEVLFAATSLSDALTQLDNIDRVASLNADVLTELRSARTKLASASRELAARTARLQAALRAAAASEASLAQARAARAAYVARLMTRRNLNSAQISSLEARAQAAQTRTKQLTGSPPAATLATPAVPESPLAVTPFGSARTLTVTITGYALPGTTATGIPVGWGVAAVDPSVIPLGTHIWVPGYGVAVAADVGGAIIGTRVDLWFPTVAQAQTWGLRTLTIALQ